MQLKKNNFNQENQNSIKQELTKNTYKTFQVHTFFYLYLENSKSSDQFFVP